MCGISGIFDRSGNTPNNSSIKIMNSFMDKRGPDHEAIFTSKYIGLGHKRLSILDLSKDANQPFFNNDNSLAMIVNGEIYNHKEIRIELKEKGYIFNSKSDSEVIVHGYQEWGIQLVKKLRGMFAIAIWDNNLKRLILIRDRIGKKPLFYIEKNGVVYFASDIKSIFFVLDQKPEINLLGLDCYLTYLCVPHNHSIFKGVKKVHPGTMILFDKNKTQISRYWNIDFSLNDDSPEEEIINKVDKIILKSTQSRMESDVPLGAFLSGGIDSSLVVRAMSQSQNKIKTFTASFQEQEFNEANIARQISEICQTEHIELNINPGSNDEMFKFLWNYGEPFADSSAFPTYLIAKEAKKHITVALSGDGGDESGFGYSTYKLFYWANLYKKLTPKAINHLNHLIIQKLYKKTGNSFIEKGKRFLDYVNGSLGNLYINKSVFRDYREFLYSKDFLNKLDSHHPDHLNNDLISSATGDNDIERLAEAMIGSWLPDDLLTKVDVATMSNSLELRSPLLDQDFMEYMASIPASKKIINNQPKYLLRKVHEKYFPKWISKQKKKGFTIPLDQWLRTDMKEIVYSTLLGDDMINSNFFQYNSVKRIIDEHMHGTSHGHRIWTLLCYQLWEKNIYSHSIDF